MNSIKYLTCNKARNSWGRKITFTYFCKKNALKIHGGNDSISK